MRLIYLLALSSMATPTLAQDREAPDTGSEIVVVGNRDQQGEQRQQIQKFVRALSTEGWDSPMTRFEKVCPGVIGLSPAQNLAIATRIRAVAKAANITVAKEDCKANLRVVVVPDRDEMLTLLEKKSVRYCSAITMVDRWRSSRKMVPSPHGTLRKSSIGAATRWKHEEASLL